MDGDCIRIIPISPSLVTFLQEWHLMRGRPARGENLLGVRGKMLRSRGRDKLEDTCEALEIEPFAWHGVRRRVVRRLRKAGVSIKGAAFLLGHSPTVMLRIYDELEPGDVEDELAAMWAK